MVSETSLVALRHDKAFCHTCIKAIKLGKISATKSEEAFTKTRFQSWKKALEKNSGLAKHNDSNSYKKASEDLMKASDLMMAQMMMSVSY